MTSRRRVSYEFGPFRVDVHARVVLRGGELVPITPKAVELLVALIEARGEVRTKDQLLKQVWPDSFVEEANLSHQIYKLREALSHTQAEPFIQTVPRRGYRFVAPVIERVSSGDPTPAPVVIDVDPPSAPTLSWGEREVTLSQGRNLLGRTADCVIRVEAVSVSREHARIVVDRQDARIEDLNSKNGTFVNGKRVTGSVTLDDGDEIRIGSVPLIFHSNTAPQTTRTLDRSS
jgi:DNA-binding winged helix-turn-helix (wHTH) protein